MHSTKPIDYFSLKHPLRGLASRASLRARQKMFAKFVTEMEPTSTSTVADIGVTPDESLPESNFFETMYPQKQNLTATSIEDASFLEIRHPGLRFVQTSGDSLPFRDAEFDIVVCFAVLEHVGSRESQASFVKELLRIGKSLFLTTPNRGFPLELHTFLPVIHWLPQPLHQRILRLLGFKFWAKTENLNLLTEKELASLFPPERRVRMAPHRIFGIASNLIAIVDPM